MVAIEYLIGGRRVTPTSMTSRLEATMLQGITRQVQDKLRTVWCPYHQQWPRVVVVGPSADAVRFEVGACCPNLKFRAIDALN
jgi:hypothetical protein